MKTVKLNVFIAIGVKWWVLESYVYLTVLLEAARSAAAASFVAALSTYVLATVMSHASGLPLVHGMRVAPSGLLPSDRDRPTDSLTDGYCVLFTALKIIIIIIIIIIHFF